jgi:sulfate adenylyltransferase subunit 1 (EFTu-like GTPase family)
MPDPITASQPVLLRLATAGSVDDGKSTLIGRLLYDTQSIMRAQLDELARCITWSTFTSQRTTTSSTRGFRCSG